jgi:chloride channel 7
VTLQGKTQFIYLLDMYISELRNVFIFCLSLQVVIMVEGTGGIDFILPVILAIVISNWVAHHIHHAGAYEADLERLGMVFLY